MSLRFSFLICVSNICFNIGDANKCSFSQLAVKLVKTSNVCETLHNMYSARNLGAEIVSLTMTTDNKPFADVYVFVINTILFQTPNPINLSPEGLVTNHHPI